MSFTHTISKTYKTDAGTTTSASYTKTGSTDLAWDGTIAVSTTNDEVDLVFTNASIVSLCIFSDAAVTIKTNSTGSPDNTITMTANKQIIWNANEAGTNPFVAADVTKLYFTNASSSVVANVKIRLLLSIS